MQCACYGPHYGPKVSCIQEKQLALLDSGEVERGKQLQAPWQDRVMQGVCVVKARELAWQDQIMLHANMISLSLVFTACMSTMCQPCVNHVSIICLHLMNLPPILQLNKTGTGLSALQMVGAAASVALLYGRPVVHLPPEILSPMQRWLALPHGRDFSSFGAIAIMPWLLLCDRAGSALVRAVLPARRASVAATRAAGSSVGSSVSSSVGKGGVGLPATGQD